MTSQLHGDHFGGLLFLILDGQFSKRAWPLVSLRREAHPTEYSQP